MSITIPERLPDEITSGDTIKWYFSEGQFDASADALVYSFVNASEQIEVTCADNGDGRWLCTISAAVSTGFDAGNYSFQAKITTAASEVYTVKTGTVLVKADYAAASSGTDTRSHVKKTLDALESMLEGKASKDQSSYSIAGRSLSRMSVDELMKWRDKYRSEYQREQAAERLARGLGSGSIVRTRL